MKFRLNNILLILVLLGTLSGCSDDWLDEASNTQIPAKDQFSDADGFKDALMGVYITMTSSELYGKDMTWNLVDLLSQQYAVLPALADYNDVQMFSYRTAESTSQVDALWIKSYGAIANVNLALTYIDEQESILDPIDYSIIKGELLGLRVFLHFDLMRLYGYGDLKDRPELLNSNTIPYITEFKKEVTPQVSYNEVLSKMKADLELSMELLEEDPIFPGDKPANYYIEVNRNGFYDNREQRMNYFAVKSLMARVLLWEGDDTAAAVIAEEIIEDSFAGLINSDSYDIANDPILYPELLFCLDIDGFSDMVNPIMDASDDGTNYNALYFTQTAIQEYFETSNTNVGIADVRYNSLIRPQTRGLVNVKLIQEGNTYPNQMPLMKISEMYYILAENYINNNQLDQAADVLNTVRQSRGILEDIEVVDAASMQEELMKEYRKEFLCEGQLFYYYKRTGTTKIYGVSETIELDDTVYMLPYPDNEYQYGNNQ
ncbi:RagB/SusD family nutrient uptake outer membrane protein [Robertkochia solimangrovi]|uniref:RagB/SusD family nutrient uptake outer membrane protein n=1 Tax=Robertkochia solimangrovi TaxID=2213046 RepID=UPI0011802FC7|nr:RagB/SusD family nutrient uptake outer membrane protein [Robertkochia solimangrovi]TRZ45186.1 RagB/SusD family nutrient uptake outer membrane protein [Robertkochia solimangrovi]